MWRDVLSTLDSYWNGTPPTRSMMHSLLNVVTTLIIGAAAHSIHTLLLGSLQAGLICHIQPPAAPPWSHSSPAMPVDVPCWWYLSGQCRHMGDRFSSRCRFMHESYDVMLALTTPVPHCDSGLPDCLPSCDQYRLRWNEGYGCSSTFEWFMFPTPDQCPCKREVLSDMETEADGMSDDDVIVVKKEEYSDNVHQHQQLKQQERQDSAVVHNRESPEAGEGKDEKEAEDDGDESDDDAEQEWTAILPVPLHYLCLRALSTPAFALCLASAMGQTESDRGVHVIMHQQPCDARTPLKWGHVILYGTKGEVERGKRALCAIMDSGYQHKADGRLLVAAVQSLKQESAGRPRAREVGPPMRHPISGQSDDEDWSYPPRRRGADEDEYDDDGDDEEWTTEDEAEFGVPNPPDDPTPIYY